MKISVCIISNKINALLHKCISSYLGVCSEICIGLNGVSKEDTQQLQNDFPTCSIHTLKWQGYSNTKNHLAKLAQNDWILSVDADELATPQLRASLKAIKFNSSDTIYTIKRLNFLGQKQIKYGAWGAGKNLLPRLYNKHHAQWDAAEVHESLDYSSSAPIIQLNGAFNHFSAPSLEAIKIKNQHYAKLWAKGKAASKKTPPLYKCALSPLMTLVKELIVKKGFLDGKVGLQIALANANYTRQKYLLWHQMTRN